MDDYKLRKKAGIQHEQQDNDRVIIDKEFLLKLKVGIIEAICHEDGLDGGEGIYLLSYINSLLGLEVDDL